MRALQFHQFGDSAKVLSIENVPVPEIKSDELLVKMHLSPIHTHNRMRVEGVYGGKVEFPACAGSEALGIVVKVGSNVKDFQEGDKVACGACAGTWAEFFAVPSRKAWRVPDGMKDELAAQISEMPLSAWLLCDFLEKTAGLSKGDWFLQNAAGGTVGQMLSVFAGDRGFKGLSFVRDKEKAEALSQKGIKVVCTQDSYWKADVKKILGTSKAKIVIDSVGGEAGADLLPFLDEEGQFVIFGNLTGKPLSVPAGDFIFSDRILRGFWAAPLKEKLQGEAREAVLKRLASYMREGRIHLPVSKIYPLEEIEEAIRESRMAGREGKVLLTC
ncbi:NADPH:quinone oxidoreductase [Acetobacteraceae bacterium]|nr:NADPH:quinone oxidoreductase [Acetobacteraceae bacterium]